MLSAKEILQIDATMIAGIFILMTINSVLNGGTLTDQMQKTDDKIKQIEQLKPQKQILEQELNKSLQDAEMFSSEANMTSGNDAQIKLLQMNNAINEYKQTNLQLNSLETQLAEELQLNETQAQLTTKISDRNAEMVKLDSHLPEIWIYRVGGSFSISGILAIFMSIFDSDKNSRKYLFFTIGSVIFMIGGFVGIILTCLSLLRP